jgi:O-antigen/teichoic acid export membrane protein
MRKHEIVAKSVRGGVVVSAAMVLQYAVGLAAQITLARLLAPELFGAVAFATLVALFFGNLSNTNGNRYVIRESTDVQAKLDNVYTLEAALSVVVLCFLLLVAPWLMAKLGKPELTLLVQVLAVMIFQNPLLQPRTLLERDLAFLAIYSARVAGQLIGAVLGIIMACRQMGVWSLVGWRVGAMAAEALIVWWVAPYRPRFRWNGEIQREILRFGWPLIGSSILIFFYWNIDYYIVGKTLGQKQLGYYWLAFEMSHYLLKARTAVNSVLFPSFSRLQKREDIRRAFNLLTRSTAIVFMFPAIVTLVAGPDAVALVFGEKWLPATRVLQIFMVLIPLRAVMGYWDPVCLFYGKTKLMLVATVANAVFIAVLGFPCTRRFGIEGMAVVVLLSTILVAPFIAFVMHRLIQASYLKLLMGPMARALLCGALFAALYRVLGGAFGVSGKLGALALFTLAYGWAFASEIKSVRRHHG